MNSVHSNELYYHDPSTNSSRMHRQAQTLQRQPSRQFDGFPDGVVNMCSPENFGSRYDQQPRFSDRMNSGVPGGFGTYDLGGQQPWNTSGYGSANHLAALGATNRAKPAARGRSALPPMWLEQPPPIPGSSNFQGLGAGLAMGGPSMRSDALGSEPDEDLIPTAIVIKNIPFAVKKEQLVQVMTDMCLPLPYAFNYHFDNGIFRGLAFANFTTPEETAAVIGAMNHLDLHGRKLRVEYKKMLPQVERDRIEREKRERRGQLEEQHRPMAPPILHSQPSMSSMSSNVPANSPSPNSAGAIHSVLDMNDPITLQYYTKLIMFQGDGNQETLAFPPSLPPTHRKVVHGLAHQLGLGHVSNGTGEQRQVHIFKNQTGNSNGLSPTISSSIHPLDAQRRQLNRSATTDFTNVRAAEPTLYSNMNTQSTGFLGFPEAQGGGLSVGSNLRNAKSFADLRSYTPSPSHSAASFPAGLASNIARYSEYGQSSPGSSRPNGNGNGNGMGNGNGNGTGNGNGNGSNNTNVDALLANGMNGLNLASGFGGRSGTSPHRLRAMMSWDREGPGPIGGHRLYHMGGEDQNRNRSQGAPMRQPRGPMTDRGPGFSRGRPNGQQNHGGGEDGSINGVEIVVE